MLVLALLTLVLHNSMRLHVSQCFHCVKTDMVHKRVFSPKKRVLAQLTWFLLKNAFKRKEMLVLALVSLVRHNSMRLHISQCFHCVKTDMVQKRVFRPKYCVLAHLTSYLLKKAFKTQENACFSVS